MNQLHRILTAIVFVFTMSVIIGCSGTTKPSMDDGDEESGTELTLNETYDKVRNGARLILAYDAQTKALGQRDCREYHRRNLEAGPG